MKIKNKIKNATPSMDDLISYPKESLGFHLGCFLFNNKLEAYPIAEQEDIYRLLIMKETSNREEIGMHFYLIGNGSPDLRRVFVAISALIICPFWVGYFVSKYKDGKAALRFYDLDHFRMLKLPLQRIKDTFLIR